MLHKNLEFGEECFMNKLLSVGEALIDMIPEQVNAGIAEVEKFQPIVGGAPANVCGAFVKLGGEAEMITQLGDDPFGDKIVSEFEQFNIGSTYVKRTNKANTALAFVALKDDGNREFSFYRRPSADMLFSAEDVKEEWFKDEYALHFCSVSLGDFPMKEAHKQAIAYAEKAGLLISFDPNLRKPLWSSEQALYNTVHEFIPYAHILKISDEELEFLTGKTEILDALDQLFVGNVKMIIYTKGSDGAECYTKKTTAFAPCEKVKAIDTTGAGDGFIGSFLYQLYQNGINAENIADVSAEQMEEFLKFSNRFCGYSVQRKGAIASYPTMNEI